MQIVKEVSVVVNPSLSIPERIIYNRMINESNFPPDGKSGEVQLLLVNMERNCYTEDVLCTLKYAGLRPATVRELLALAESSKEVYPNYVIALGSIYMKHGIYQMAVYLEDSFTGRRGMSLFQCGKYSKNCLFLAVREE